MPGTVRYLRLAVASLLHFSGYSFRLVANGLDRAERQLLADYCDSSPRLEYFDYPVSRMLDHGTMLNVLFQREASPWFAMADSDIFRCPPWRAKRRRVVPGSREATRDTRRAEGAKGDPKGASERGVQSYGRPVCSRNELAMLWRNAG